MLTDIIGGWAGIPEAVAGLEAITALGRTGEPDDIADVVASWRGLRAAG
ncbi:hypothetical protein [Streptomyces sp. NPDC057552]